jgi:hypothetical protein
MFKWLRNLFTPEENFSSDFQQYENGDFSTPKEVSFVTVRDPIRVIKTARTLEDINNATTEGLTPLIKAIKPNPKIQHQFAICRNITTGEFKKIHDYRDWAWGMPGYGHPGPWEKVLDWSFYYPHNFPAPYAAYLIPNDLEAGEKVLLEDLIEDVVDYQLQDFVIRMQSCEAVWNGKDFELIVGNQQRPRIRMG